MSPPQDAGGEVAVLNLTLGQDRALQVMPNSELLSLIRTCADDILRAKMLAAATLPMYLSARYAEDGLSVVVSLDFPRDMRIIRAEGEKKFIRRDTPAYRRGDAPAALDESVGDMLKDAQSRAAGSRENPEDWGGTTPSGRPVRRFDGR